MAHFNPWRNALDRDCHTCRFSIGMRDGAHLWCQRHRLVTVFGCGWWEREPGTEQARSHRERRLTFSTLGGPTST